MDVKNTFKVVAFLNTFPLEWVRGTRCSLRESRGMKLLLWKLNTASVTLFYIVQCIFFYTFVRHVSGSLVPALLMLCSVIMFFQTVGVLHVINSIWHSQSFLIFFNQFLMLFERLGEKHISHHFYIICT